ncbi:uncharacterized protein A4U43_C03F25330 [Asparagus officinalis]|uniref:Uncharacterized protein n=1 Tax=Asparagus officinalis TaxID=4686 RepID=A0A5P1FCU3_ASPOF|nr:uncharacterized protein A4U43_C03F25330 [Asparagus officinalis]
MSSTTSTARARREERGRGAKEFAADLGSGRSTHRVGAGLKRSDGGDEASLAGLQATWVQGLDRAERRTGCRGGRGVNGGKHAMVELGWQAVVGFGVEEEEQKERRWVFFG